MNQKQFIRKMSKDEEKVMPCPVCGLLAEEHSPERSEACKEAYLKDLKATVEKMELAWYVSQGHGTLPTIVLDLSQFEGNGASLTRIRARCGTNYLIEHCEITKYGIELHSTHNGCFHSNPAAGPFNISWQEIEDAAKLEKDYEKIAFDKTQVRITRESLHGLLQMRDGLNELQVIH
jgi:hypothetical protein